MLKFLAVLLLLTTGCASNPDAKSLIETLEFGPDETGCFRVSGNIDVGGNPFASTTINVILVKRKQDAEGWAPDC